MTAQARWSQARCVSRERSKCMRNLPWTDASISQMPVALREVVPLICVELVGAASRTAGEPRHTWNGIDPRFEHHRVMAIGAGHAQRQGYAAPVYGEMAFAVELAAIRGIRPCLFACPGGLATVALSMLARPQSIWSCSRRRLSSAKCSRSQTPSACQSRKRRQHVIPLPKPNSFGRSSHGIPVCKTNRMPFSAARSPARGWPPLAEGFTTGSSGCRTFHNALLIFFQAMSPKTSMDRCQMTWLFRNYKTSLAVEGLPRRIDQHRPYD